MRKDLLVRSRSSSKLGAPAADAIAKFYGDEAVPWVERSLKRDRLAEQERRQLIGLRDRLAAP